MNNISCDNTVTIKGEIFGVKLHKRGTNDPHIIIRFLIEDDGQWFDSEFSLSSAWIDDVIEVLKHTKRELKTYKPDIYEGQQYGYRFRESKE